MKKRGLKKGDIIIFVAVIFIAAASLLCINLFSHSGEIVVIEVDGKVIEKLLLSEDAVFNVVQHNVITNQIKIENSEVSVTYADCPDLICHKHKPISRSGESIICLPNRVTVSISGDYSEIDGVAE